MSERRQRAARGAHDDAVPTSAHGGGRARPPRRSARISSSVAVSVSDDAGVLPSNGYDARFSADRTEADAGNQAFEADRVRAQVLHDGGRQEPRREEAVVVPGEPLGPRTDPATTAAAGRRAPRTACRTWRSSPRRGRPAAAALRRSPRPPCRAGAIADRPDCARPARSRTPRWRTPPRARSVPA